jgi:tryptophanyl-tRNA synthetase
MIKETILTGIRANDIPTLGNYLGAILPIVQIANSLTEDSRINCFVPDLHSITTPIDHDSLQDNIEYNTKLFVAAGLPIQKQNVNLYRQSYISAHSELAWILSCFTGFGEASRMVEFKDKSAQIGGERVSVGLFTYPILMSADILLYDAKWVPIGEDQRQHLELTRELAIRFNNKFGDIFTVPETIDKQQHFLNRDKAPRIRSLKNPSKKMSKSVNDPTGTILLTDDPSSAVKKVMSATTDSLSQINYDWERQPGITNLLTILSLLTDKDQSQINTEWVGRSSYGELKKAVASAVESELIRLQNEINNVANEELENTLIQSEDFLRNQANDKLLQVQQAVGLR